MNWSPSGAALSLSWYSPPIFCSGRKAITLPPIQNSSPCSTPGVWRLKNNIIFCSQTNQYLSFFLWELSYRIILFICRVIFTVKDNDLIEKYNKVDNVEQRTLDKKWEHNRRISMSSDKLSPVSLYQEAWHSAPIMNLIIIIKFDSSSFVDCHELT